MAENQSKKPAHEVIIGEIKRKAGRRRRLQELGDGSGHEASYLEATMGELVRILCNMIIPEDHVEKILTDLVEIKEILAPTDCDIISNTLFKELRPQPAPATTA